MNVLFLNKTKDMNRFDLRVFSKYLKMPSRPQCFNHGEWAGPFQNDLKQDSTLEERLYLSERTEYFARISRTKTVQYSNKAAPPDERMSVCSLAPNRSLR